MDIDGSDCVLPSLGTLAALSPFTNWPRPRLVACTQTWERTLPVSTVLEAVQNGVQTDDLAWSRKNVGCGHYTISSFFAYMYRRSVPIMRKPTKSPGPTQALSTLQLATEAATHFMFLFSFLLLVGTPVHEVYGRGKYCSAFRELVKCEYGRVEGFNSVRVFPAVVAGVYSGTLHVVIG